jgi:DIS3-like exonuclease 2 C terminal
MASNCNGKKWSAKVAGEQSIDLFLALYLGMNGAMTEEAVVISVMDYSLDVLVLSTGSNHRVYTNVRMAIYIISLKFCMIMPVAAIFQTIFSVCICRRWTPKR